MDKRERLSKQMYREIAKSNHEKAEKIMKKIIDMDVESLKKRLSIKSSKEDCCIAKEL